MLPAGVWPEMSVKRPLGREQTSLSVQPPQGTGGQSPLLSDAQLLALLCEGSPMPRPACLESIPASLTHLVRALIGPAGAAPRRLRARDEEALDSLDRTAGVRHPRPGTPSHHLDGTIQYVRPCSATGTFMEPSDKRTWIGAVLMGGRTSELIINCDWQRRQFPKIPLRKGIIRCGGASE